MANSLKQREPGTPLPFGFVNPRRDKLKRIRPHRCQFLPSAYSPRHPSGRNRRPTDVYAKRRRLSNRSRRAAFIRRDDRMSEPTAAIVAFSNTRIVRVAQIVGRLAGTAELSRTPVPGLDCGSGYPDLRRGCLLRRQRSCTMAHCPHGLRRLRWSSSIRFIILATAATRRSLGRSTRPGRCGTSPGRWVCRPGISTMRGTVTALRSLSTLEAVE